jgi:aspartate carbamoyltransferase catalytic subunit
MAAASTATPTSPSGDLAWSRKDLLGIAELSAGEITTILDVAESFREVADRPIKKLPTLRGRTVVNLFFENSTRTRSSFEIAEKRLSADGLNFSASSSALSKGESLVDTAMNLQAMSPDLIVIRHAHAGAPHLLAKRLDAGVINAGDGAHEHPTQALLDAFTIRQHKGDIRGLKISIVGDIEHSRVVRSNIHCLSKLGAEVTVAGPRTLMPPGLATFEAEGVRVVHSLDEAVEGADVVMMLRIQLERQGRMAFPSTREYFRLFGLTPERLERASDDVIVMHPGPMNRGVEISSAVADGPTSVILEQVANGVAVRMAVLYLLAGAAGEGK